MNIKKYGGMLKPLTLLTLFSMPALAHASNLVITEIMYNPKSPEDNWEWVEIYNASSSAIDLAGHVLDDGNGTGHTASNIAGGSIGAGDFAVLFNVDDVSQADFEAAWEVSLNAIPVTGWSKLSLNNSGDRVGIWGSFDDYQDDHATHSKALSSVAYTGEAPWPVDDGKGTIYLKNLQADVSDGSQWLLSSEYVVDGLAISSQVVGDNSGEDLASPGFFFETPNPDAENAPTVYVSDAHSVVQDSDANQDGINDLLAQHFDTNDADNDGIPDALEELIASAANVSLSDINASSDQDGDGMPDVAELLVGRNVASNENADVAAPNLNIASSSISLRPTGILSPYSADEQGVTGGDGDEALSPVAYLKAGACETALPYNFQAVCRPVAATGYPAGRYDVWWVVLDSDGHWAQDSQMIKVLPSVSFSGDLTLSGYAGEASIESLLKLSANSVSDSVIRIPFAVSGTAQYPAEHDLQAGEFIIPAGASSSEPVTITLGAEAVSGHTLTIQLDTNATVFAPDSGDINASTQFVVAGNPLSQTITLTVQQAEKTGNVPYLSALRGKQGDVAGLMFDKTQGNVTLAFTVQDSDGGDYQYSWANSDERLALANGAGLRAATTATPMLDLSALEAGAYYTEMRVVDNDASHQTPVVLSSMLTVLDTSALSTTMDTDQDGQFDVAEGLTDSDQDGRSDFVDAYNDLPNIAPTNQDQQRNYLAKTDSGVRLLFGHIATAAFTGDLEVSEEDVRENGNKGQSVTNAILESTQLVQAFDFILEGMEVGQSADLVLPLSSALTSASQFQFYTVDQGWQKLSSDSNNKVQWSLWKNGLVGDCPEAGQGAYQSVIAQEGNSCLQVTLQDGGAYDADGVANGRIAQTLAVTSDEPLLTSSNVVTDAIEDKVDESLDEAKEAVNNLTSSGSGGSGSLQALWLLLLGSLLWLYRRNH